MGSPSVTTPPGGAPAPSPVSPPPQKKIRFLWDWGFRDAFGTSGMGSCPEPGAQRRDCSGPPPCGVPRAPVPATAGPRPPPAWSPQWFFVPLQMLQLNFPPPSSPLRVSFPPRVPTSPTGVPQPPVCSPSSLPLLSQFAPSLTSPTQLNFGVSNHHTKPHGPATGGAQLVPNIRCHQTVVTHGVTPISILGL